MKDNNTKFKNVVDLINADTVGHIFFITPNPNRAIGIEKEIKNYHIICSQKTDIVNCLKKDGILIMCLDDESIRNSGKILENKKVIKYIKSKTKEKNANIITFKPSPKIAKICDRNGFRYLGNDWELSRKLEDKIEFVGITEKTKIPNANSFVIKLEEKIVADYYSNLKNKGKFVAQLPRGFSGNSTFLIENEKSFIDIINKYKGRKVKVSKFIEGMPYTLNACISEGGIFISQPIFQITGINLYNRNKLGTCGNDYDYGRKIKIEEKKKIFRYTKKIGEYMKKIGYNGIFGLDFIVSNNTVDLIEINPRLIGSIPVFTKLQIQGGQMPFMLMHILEFLNDNDVKNIKSKFREPTFYQWNNLRAFSDSQLILRNISEKPLKIKKSLLSGIYSAEKGKIVLKDRTYYKKRNLKKNEFLLHCLPKGSVINSDMEYANIQVGYGIMKNKKQFSSYFNNIVRIVLENIKIKAL